MVYLVSGANRGIGLALTAALAARPQSIVFAGARDPSTATELQALARAFPGKVHPVKLISCDQQTHVAAVNEIRDVAGRLDVVIANAGICDAYGSIFETTPDELRTHFDINVVGPQILFKETYPLLKASNPTPKFIVISSLGGSLALGPGMPVLNGAYAISKAALNYLARKLHYENEGLVANTIAKDESLKSFADVGISPAESAAGLIKVVEGSTRSKNGGEFFVYDGSKLAW
ncbi:hypothetical protein HWV62_15114 [Athelia sp. TMB]|nr:hypothetical protein HWV62_15114 [Athelia sp. TMB]